ncbi:5-hydroxytryptamine receptor 3A-like [Biomphalaria glabrata]|uniref:5-hydroxytryptamine receptor 3A-like n=1 Tax=Biomphalaria glabrata TaxID=6526 RepID=A0A9W3BHL8_BIOGL|nr:5-hydroxytryptamine receptor 3A-like [Biomphalaria glabrata]KAI8780858.1 neuronal acetylcholine receptor subunit beta-4 [Biomphalaria glabrata]
MRRLAHVTELLTIVCLTEFVVHLGGAETSWRNVKAKLKADLRERRANISNVNPGDDVTNRTIDLMIYFWPFAVTQIDEVKQTVSTVSSYVISWWDSSLAWNMQDYDNISFITENINNIWSPRITIPNSADNANWVLPSVIDFCYIWHNGTVTIFTTVFVDTYCDLDLTSYPFDQQKCDILIWPFLEDSQYQLHISDIEIAPPMPTNGEWKIVSRHFQIIYYEDFSKNNLSMAKMTLTIQRSTTYYIFSIVVPLALMALMTPIVFWIPPMSGERTSYLVSIFLSMTVYLSYLVGTMPRSMNKMPKLLIYLVTIMAQTFFAIIATVCVMKTMKAEMAEGRRGHHNTPEGGFVDPFDSVSDESKNMKKNKVAPAKEESCTMRKTGKQRLITSDQWDRIFFVLYFFFCIPTFIIIYFL